MFFCTCGAINSESNTVCYDCNRNCKNVINAFNIEELKRESECRIKKEEEEKKKNEEKARIEKIKKKKKIKRIKRYVKITISIIALFLLIMGVGWITGRYIVPYIQNQIEKKEIENAIKDGRLSSDWDSTNELSKIQLSQNLTYSLGRVTGKVFVTNNANDIEKISSGRYPIVLGVSVVDRLGNIIDKDFAHLAISYGTLKSGETCEVEVNINELTDIEVKGYRLKFTIIQENISWIEDTSIYFRLEKNPTSKLYDYGKIIYFNNDNSSASRYQVSGFSYSEETSTWTDGKEAIMNFEFTTPEDIEVSFECGFYDEKQTVNLYANGNFVETIIMNEDCFQKKYTVKIPSEYILDNKLELKFGLPDAISPMQKGESIDERVLGLRMISMALLKQ